LNEKKHPLHKNETKGKNLIDIWGDHVALKDLGISVLLCVGLTLGGYLLAPSDPPQPLIFGLVGGVIGFIISSIVIKPKRKVTQDAEEEV
jgi:hypothetical protein